MKKEKIIRVLKIIITIIIIVGICIGLFFGTRKILDGIHESNLNNLSWIKKNVNLEKDEAMGKNIYIVSKDKDLNIYSDYYRKVINSKLSKVTNKNYSLNKALLIYNAYGTNDLSVNIYFNTTKEVTASYTIKVNDEKISDFSRTLYNEKEDNLETKHAYQLIGFVPGYKNEVTITLKDKSGKVVAEKTFTVDMTKIKNESEVKLKIKNGSSSEKLSNGLYTILGNDSDQQDYVFMYDNDGILRCQIPIIGYRAHAVLFKDNEMYFSVSQTKIASFNRLGKITNIYKTEGYKLHHDYTFDDDGNLIVLASKNNSGYDEDVIIKINLKNKKVSELLDMKKLLPQYVKKSKMWNSENRDAGEKGFDWIHLNSLQIVGNDIYLSARQSSSIIKVKNYKENPEIDYIIADPAIYEESGYTNYLLKKEGDFIIQAGQHYVRYRESDEDGVYYLTLFNNNYGVDQANPEVDYEAMGIANTKSPFDGDTSYYYVYKIDEKSRTFSLERDLKVPYSGIVSSAEVMDNDNIIVDSGTVGVFSEYDKDYNLIKSFTTKLHKYMVYRALKYDFNNYWFTER